MTDIKNPFEGMEFPEPDAWLRRDFAALQPHAHDSVILIHLLQYEETEQARTYELLTSFLAPGGKSPLRTTILEPVARQVTAMLNDKARRERLELLRSEWYRIKPSMPKMRDECLLDMALRNDRIAAIALEPFLTLCVMEHRSLLVIC